MVVTLLFLSGTKRAEEVVAYSDSDWAGDPITRRSVGGYLIFFGNSILCWGSKTQRGIIALSSTEAEFIQLALSVRQVLFIQPIFYDIGFNEIEKFTVLYGTISQLFNLLGMILDQTP